MATGDTQTPRRNPALSVLSRRRRRTILGLLADRPDPIPQTGLSVQIAVRESDQSVETITSEETEHIERELYHRDLPALESVALVEWDRRVETVRRTDHPLYRDPQFGSLVGDDAEFWDDLLPHIADTRRQRLLGILSNANERVPVDTVATKLLVREVTAADDKVVSSDGFDALRSELYHVHLPKLDDCGLIEWNRGNETVEYSGHPELDPDWLSPHVTDRDGVTRQPNRELDRNRRAE
jgi:hypothetical protein